MNISQKDNTAKTQNSFRDDFDYGINLTDVLLVLLKRKKMIFCIVFFAIALSIPYSLMIDKTYTATARILPPQEMSTGMSSILSKADDLLGGMASTFIGGQSSSDLYVGILKSRSVADRIIKQFNLKDVYGENSMERTYKTLALLTDIEIDRKTQIVNISVEDKLPQRAADMANLYVDALDQINRTVNITSARRKRVFLEKRLEKGKKDLLKAELELKAFQEEHGLVSIDTQARVAIEGAAKIKAEIIAAQTELKILKQFGTERQNEAIMLKSKIAELERQLSKIAIGSPEKNVLKKNTNKNPDVYISFDELPDLGMQLARLMREAKIQEEVFKLITTQHELAKIEEARDVNTIQVLDRAIPPDFKSGPKRRVIVIVSTVVAFFLAVFLAFFIEYIDRLKTEDPERYQKFIEHIKFRKPK